VRFVGATSPADGSISYNEVARTVTWNAGDVPAGTSERSAYFQVAFLPSEAQRATNPALVSGQQVSATDRFTSGKLQSSVADLTTDIRQDPAWNPSIGQVQ
jgi:hypothetical protein